MLDEVRVGDLVTGDPEYSHKYNFTNDKMLVGEVISVDYCGYFTVKILDHEDKSFIGGIWEDLNPGYFNYAKGYMPFGQSDDDCSAEIIRSLWG